MESPPQRGEVWWAYLDPTIGREQAGRRPVVIISANDYNAAGTELVLVVPTTSSQRSIPSRLPLRPPDGGLTAPSDVLIDQLRVLSIKRLRKRIGSVQPITLRLISERLRLLLDLSSA